MDTQTALTVAEKLIEPFASAMARPADPARLDAVLAPDRLIAAVKALVKARWGYLSAITGLDHPAAKPAAGKTASVPPAAAAGAPQPGGPAAAAPADGTIEVLYHFCEGAAVLTLRVSVPYASAVVPTVCGEVPYVGMYEREVEEMLGVRIEGTPMKAHFLLPEDWPEGVYPLRKAFTGFGDRGYPTESCATTPKGAPAP